MSWNVIVFVCLLAICVLTLWFITIKDIIKGINNPISERKGRITPKTPKLR